MLGTPVIRSEWDRSERPHRQLHPKLRLSTAAQAHQDMKPFFTSPVPENTRPPMGTAKPYLPESFVKREEEYNFLVSTQLLELASAEQELRQAGIGSFSLSSSSGDEDDDDMIREASISEARGCGTPYITRELQPIVRRIEWEQFVLKCSTSVHIYAKPVKAAENTWPGHPEYQIVGRTLACNDKRVKPDQLKAYVPKILDLIGDRSMYDIADARTRATHYNRLVWSLMTPEQQGDWAMRGPETHDYLTREEAGPTIEDWDGDIHSRLIADPDVEGAFITDSVPPPQPLSGPQELSLHNVSDDYVVTYEPSNRELEAWAELA